MDTTERLHFHVSLSCIGEGNGNPLQCSCLENPRDGGAWWAALSGVAQSWTRLKGLSSSSSSSSRSIHVAPNCIVSLLYYAHLCMKCSLGISNFLEEISAAAAAAAAAKSLQSCLTLCDPIDSSPPGSPVPGILQARTLEWVAISFSSA